MGGKEEETTTATGWRAAEKRLRGLLEGVGDDGAVLEACKEVLQACIDEGEHQQQEEEDQAASVAWAVDDVLRRHLRGEEVHRLREMAFRACATTGAADAAVALFLASPEEERRREASLEWALEACTRARQFPLSTDIRAAVLSLLRAAGPAAVTPRALELAASALEGGGDAGGALRLLIGEAKRVAARPVPVWLYARAMRAALGEAGEEAAATAGVMSLLYEEALAEAGQQDQQQQGEMMALHEAALAAYAAQGQWCVGASSDSIP